MEPLFRGHASSAVLAVALGVHGCVASSPIGRATPLPKGQSRIGVSVEGTTGTANLPGGRVTLPWAEMAVSYDRGLSESIEAGARLSGLWVSDVAGNRIGTLAWELHGKASLHQQGSWTLSLRPAIQHRMLSLSGTLWHTTSSMLAFCIGRDIASHQLVLAPLTSLQLLVGGGRTVLLGHLGTAIGAALRITEWLELLAEGSLAWSPVTFGGSDPSSRTRGLLTTQARLSVGVQL